MSEELFEILQVLIASIDWMLFEATLITDKEDGGRNMIIINLQTPLHQLHTNTIIATIIR